METQKKSNIIIGAGFWIVVLAALTLVLFSCKSSKPIETVHTIEKTVEYRKDSTQLIVKNQAIIDSLIIAIQTVKTAKPECDSITNAEIQKILSRLNTIKKSGDNEAGIYYDELKKLIIAWQKVGATQNKETTVATNATSNNNEQHSTTIPVRYIPKHIEYLAWFGFLMIIYYSAKTGLWIYRKIYPVTV